MSKTLVVVGPTGYSTPQRLSLSSNTGAAYLGYGTDDFMWFPVSGSHSHAHADLSGVTSDQHHAQSHDHSNASDDTTLAPTQVAVVNDTAGAIPLSVKGHASQSADIFVAEKSDGTDLLVVAPDGHLSVGAQSLDEGIIVAGNARPRVILDSGNTVKTRVFQRESAWYRGGLSVNLAWPGQYDLDDTGRAGWHLVLDADGDYLAISRASAGSNPRTLTEFLRISSAGILTAPKTIQHVRDSGPGSISSGGVAVQTVTFGSAFDDANYTAIACVRHNGTNAAKLNAVVETKSAGSLTVRWYNAHSASITPDGIEVIAIHD